MTKPRLAFVQRQPRPVHRSVPGSDWHLFSASPPVCRSAPSHLIYTSAVSVRRLNHIYLLRLSRQSGWYLDAANHGISNGHTVEPSNLPGL